MTAMADRDPAAGRDVCELHGEPLQDAMAGTMDLSGGVFVEPDLALEEVERRHFPHAETIVAGWSPEPQPVRYCPACREAKWAWQKAPGAWESKAVWMRAGYDPYRGEPVRTPDARLVDDYVWIEKWVRAAEALELSPWLIAFGSCRTPEEYILQEVAAARAGKAPLDAVFRSRGEWRTLEQVQEEVMLGALGLALP